MGGDGAGGVDGRGGVLEPEVAGTAGERGETAAAAGLLGEMAAAAGRPVEMAAAAGGSVVEIGWLLMGTTVSGGLK
jgi:hypothetical protein